MANRRSTLPDLRGDGNRTTYRLRSQGKLIREMRYRGFNTGRSLAMAAGLKQGAVNHLVFGRRDTCSPETASAIEEALDLRPGTLFFAIESSVPRDSERSTA